MRTEEETKNCESCKHTVAQIYGILPCAVCSRNPKRRPIEDHWQTKKLEWVLNDKEEK